MIPHHNHMLNIHGLNRILKLSEKDSVVSYLPLCHILERSFSVSIPLVCGYTINFAESIETVQENINEISPSFFAAVPRILEKMHSAVMLKIQDTTPFKRFMFQMATSTLETLCSAREEALAMRSQPTGSQSNSLNTQRPL